MDPAKNSVEKKQRTTHEVLEVNPDSNTAERRVRQMLYEDFKKSMAREEPSQWKAKLVPSLQKYKELLEQSKDDLEKISRDEAYAAKLNMEIIDDPSKTLELDFVHVSCDQASSSDDSSSERECFDLKREETVEDSDDSDDSWEITEQGSSRDDSRR